MPATATPLKKPKQASRNLTQEIEKHLPENKMKNKNILIIAGIRESIGRSLAVQGTVLYFKLAGYYSPL
jgi:hypothetical protein